MKLLTRRALLTSGVVGSVATVVTGRSTGAHAASPAPTDVTLWRLNPDWGFPLTTATGSSTKSRCRGSACHTAAPHRFFLTEADAIAGRLHACCLAQPEPITVCINLNELMPYYTARLGGVDGRCPTLPAALGQALYAADACTFSTPTSTAPATTAPATTAPATGGSTPGADTTTTTVVAPVDPPTTTGVDSDRASQLEGELPATGSSTGPILAAAVAVTVAGAALAATRPKD